MNNEEFSAISRAIDVNAELSLDAKGKDYTSEKDRLSDFKMMGNVVRTILGPRPISPADPALIATVFFVKHLIPLVKYSFGEGGESEPIFGRAGDAINYIKLMVAIGQERRVTMTGATEGAEYWDGLDLVRDYPSEEDREVENTSGPLREDPFSLGDVVANFPAGTRHEPTDPSV